MIPHICKDILDIRHFVLDLCFFRMLKSIFKKKSFPSSDLLRVDLHIANLNHLRIWLIDLILTNWRTLLLADSMDLIHCRNFCDHRIVDLNRLLLRHCELGCYAFFQIYHKKIHFAYTSSSAHSSLQYRSFYQSPNQLSHARIPQC